MQNSIPSSGENVSSYEAVSLHDEQDPPHYGEATICTRIASWRARDTLRRRKREELGMKAYIQMESLLGNLDPENGLIFDIREEQRTLEEYKNPGRLRERFRSEVLDILFLESGLLALREDEQYQKFRQALSPYPLFHASLTR